MDPDDTNDATGLHTLTLLSSDTNNLLSSIPYAAFGDLVEFDFTYPDAVTATQAFSVFTIDNSVYTNISMPPPIGQSFTNENFASFITAYTERSAARDAHPVVDLLRLQVQLRRGGAHRHERTAGLAGLPGRLEPDELQLAVYYLDGLRARPDAADHLQHGPGTDLPGGNRHQSGHLDGVAHNIAGIGGNITFIDNRVLSGVSAVFYRVAVY